MVGKINVPKRCLYPNSQAMEFCWLVLRPLSWRYHPGVTRWVWYIQMWVLKSGKRKIKSGSEWQDDRRRRGDSGRRICPHVVTLNMEERPRVKNWPQEPEITLRWQSARKGGSDSNTWQELKSANSSQEWGRDNPLGPEKGTQSFILAWWDCIGLLAFRTTRW